MKALVIIAAFLALVFLAGLIFAACAPVDREDLHDD